MEQKSVECSTQKLEKTVPVRARHRRITVEPILLALSLFYYTYSNVSKQYIYEHFSYHYGLVNYTRADECSIQNESKAIKDLEAKVSASSSQWVLYLDIGSLVPSFLTTVVIGSWGDMVGRKPALLCNITGFIVLCLVSILTIQLTLPLYCLLIARILSGLLGGIYGAIGSCFSYIADVSSHQDRTLRVAVGEASSGIGGLIASLACGILIDMEGFGPPMWLMGALLVFFFFYIALLLPESNIPQVQLSSSQKLRALCDCGIFSGIKTLFTESWNRSLKLLGLVFCFFLLIINFSGVWDTIVIYELSPPLCWSATLAGYGSAMISCQFLASIVVIKGFQGRLTDLFLVSFSTISGACSLVIYGFARVTWMMFLGLTVGLFTTVGATVVRSMVSRFVGFHHQGAAFAILACSESFANLSGSLLFNEIYSDTVGTYAGLIFFIGAGIYVATFVIFWFVYKQTKDDLDANLTEEYQSLSDALINDDAATA